MTNTIGRVDFTATLDGRRTPQEAENIGRKAGAAAGEGYDKTWSKSFRDTLSKSGQRSYDAWQKSGGKDGTVYGKALSARLASYLKTAQKNFESLRLDPGFLDDFLKKYDDAGLAAGDLQRQLVTLSESNKISATSFKAAQRQVDEWALSQRTAGVETNNTRDAIVSLQENLRSASISYREHTAAIDAANKKQEERTAILADSTRKMLAEFAAQDRESARAAAAAERLAAAQDKVTKANTAQEHGWRSLSHNTRQWTLIIGAVASGMQDISVLGSAAGGGLIALGGAGTAAVAGISATAAVLVTLNKELDELPEHLRPVAAEFKRFTPVFGELREAIATGAFGEMAGVFDRLGDNLRSLSPDLTVLGASVGNVFDRLSRSTGEGSEALEEIRTTIRLAGADFEDMAGSAGTFGVAFLRSFNRAQPLVQDLLNYVDLLANRLDDFSRSTGFDDWMRNSQRVFGSLGPLIDATARALNDLVTPETVNQTADLLDDLTGFMPVLSDILGVIGSANPFGLIAQGLNEAGEALAPLMPALDDLAGELSEVASDVIPVLAEALGLAARAATPLVQSAADIIDALPPEALQAIAAGIVGIGLGFGTWKAGAAIVGTVTALKGLTTAAETATVATGGLGTKIKGALGKAGMAGLGIAGALALVESIKGIAREISDVDDKVRNFVASGTSLTDIFSALNEDMQGNSLVGQFDGLANALERLPEVGHGVTGVFGNIGLAFDEAGGQALALSGTLGELDPQIANMANTSVAAAADRFSLWVDELGATDEQAMAMLNSMPQFKAVLEDVAIASGTAATDQNLLALAMGTASAGVRDNTQALGELQGKSYETGGAIDGLADKIRGFGSATLTTRDAERQFQQAVDDLSGSLTTNGTTLDTNEQQGRDNQAAIDDLAQSALDYAGATYEQTGSIDEATGALKLGRDELVRVMQQFGLTEDEANAYADSLGLIPSNIPTAVRLDGVQAAQNQIDRFIRDNNGRVIRIYTQTSGPAAGFNQDAPFASGGTVYGPTRALIGEAGPEMVVPLSRPLSQVDESVRWLSAIAQGKSSVAMASGGVAGLGGNNLNVHEGAIVVSGTSDPRRAANEVLQRLAEKVNG